MSQGAARPPAQLPSNFDAWLLDCTPAPNCAVCAANWRQLTASKQSGDITQAARHATEIRDHASGVHASPTN
ncbi:hypothetical protein [Streptomyces sp. cg40]|uniref:hypothetical protein n=1 Tax=Streptomyces sp. cg40 TaxID=3419764 RepID=UPI003D055044